MLLTGMLEKSTSGHFEEHLDITESIWKSHTEGENLTQDAGQYRNRFIQTSVRFRRKCSFFGMKCFGFFPNQLNHTTPDSEPRFAQVYKSSTPT